MITIPFIRNILGEFSDKYYTTTLTMNEHSVNTFLKKYFPHDLT